MNFQMTLTVRFGEPFEMEDHNAKAVGTVVVLGVNSEDMVTALDLARKSVLAKLNSTDLDKDLGFLEDAEISIIDDDAWSADILNHIDDIKKEGVYYMSGFAYFNDEKEESKNKWWKSFKKR